MAPTRESILAMDDLPRKKLEVPEWGGDIFIRSLSAAESVRFLEQQRAIREEKKDDPFFNARVVCFTAVDETGIRIFLDSDVEELAKKSAAVINRIMNAVLEFNAMAEKSAEIIAGE